MNIKRWFLNWMVSGNSPGLVKTSDAQLSERATGNGQPAYRLTFVKAMNGRMLEVGMYKPNPHGPDWKYELYIIDSNERVSDAVAKVLAIKALEN
jgi:hypothetical protein